MFFSLYIFPYFILTQAVLRTVSLSNGLRNNDNEGYVQATLSDGRVGSICSDSWSLKEATVVCRELNKDFASRATAVSCSLSNF